MTVRETTRETSRDYAHPHRPLAIKLFNALGRAKPFEAPAVIAAAQAKTGLSRFHNDCFRAALPILIESLAETGRLSPTGRFMTAQRFAGSLAVNLRAARLFEARPELHDIALARPIVICGLARSGTTLLQRMIAELPGVRSLAAWEAFDPIPEGAWDPSWRGVAASADPRVARMRKAERFLAWLSPDLFAVHPMDATAPEEDVLLLDHMFMSGVSEASHDVRSYARWLEHQDQTPAYRWLADCLRVLQWQHGGDVWVLKSPHHLEWLDVLFEVFPDATIIQTHRDPVETVPSFCSLVAHGWGVMSDQVDAHEVGRHWLTKIERMLGRALAVREARAGAGFTDVHYLELVRDPLATMEKLCATIGLPWSEEIRARLERWLTEHRQHAHGVHRYAAEDFGLDPARIAERFTAYRDRFCP